MTIKDIARRAKVSIGTVDRVINGRGRVSPQTARRVRGIVSASGYRPNLHARSLSLRASLRVAVLMPRPEQDGGYWRLALAGIRRASAELAGFNLRTVLCRFDRYSEASFSRAAASVVERSGRGEFSGIVCAPALDCAALDLLRTLARSVPLVFFDSDVPDAPRLSYIGQDSFQSGLLAGRLMQLLAGAGPVAAVRFAAGGFHIEERMRGFTAWYERRGLPAPRMADQADADDPREAAALVDKIRLNGRSGPAGLFVANASAHLFAAAFEEHPRADRPALLGYDLIPPNVAAMRRGAIDFLISQRPEVQAYEAVRQLFRHAVLKQKPRREMLMPLDVYSAENIDYHAYH